MLCYYPFGRAFTAEGNQTIAEIVLMQVGNVGSELYWSWWGLSERAELRAMFMCWCADQVGPLDSGDIPKFENCAWSANWFKDNAGWTDGSANRAPAASSFSIGNRTGIRIMWVSLKNARAVWCIPSRVTSTTTAPRGATM